MSFHDFRLVLAALLACAAQSALAQTATTGAMVGTVSDPTGAVVPEAKVLVENVTTGQRWTWQTNRVGQYSAPNLPPGDYRVTASAPGFQTVTLTARVEVARSTLVNVQLPLGEVTVRLEVSGAPGPALQTVDAAVGQVLGERDFLRLPTTQRQATQLIFLQPLTQPAGVPGIWGGGSVAGGRADQNAVILDGVPITDLPRGILTNLTLPLDMVEEWRGTTVNPNATMGRASGGHFTFTSRRGTNEFHGAAYWYHQNDNFNANTWTRNRLGQPKPELKDNRVGWRFGGPLRRDRTFFFLFHETRRFPQSVDAVRLGITETFRKGILRFRDNSGQVVDYDLASSSLCGPANNVRCDPRGLGLSPAVRRYLEFYPAGNDPSTGDGLNTVGIRAPVDASTNTDIASLRLDHAFSADWQLSGNYMLQRQRSFNAVQVDFNPAVTGGRLLKSTSGAPADPRFLSIGLLGTPRPTLVNEFRFGWNKQDINLSRVLPTTLVPEAGSALNLGGTVIDDPGDPFPIFRSWGLWTTTRVHSLSDTLTWVKGRHNLQSGVNFQVIRSRHARFARPGAHVVPIATVGGGPFRQIPAENRPPTCSRPGQTYCLPVGQQALWDTLYAAALGIWDNTQSFHLRDAQGNPVGIAPVETDNRWKHVEIFGQDAWRPTRSLTLSFGLSFDIETPPVERGNRQFFIIDQGTGQPVSPLEWIRSNGEAAAQGRTVHPRIAYVPQRSLNRSVYPGIFEIGPRASLAWNPSWRNGWLGRLFGDGKTVFRGGYSLLFDAILTVQTQIGSVLANELIADGWAILAPTCEAAGRGGPGCAPRQSPFRIGVDGAAFSATPGPIPVPLVPAERDARRGTSFGVVNAFALDPGFGLGRVHGANFTVQRQLNPRAVWEMGWVGRWGRQQSLSANLNSPPWQLRDLTGRSAQTLAEAFDNVALELRGGVAAAAVTPQPWFENALGPGATRSLAGRASSSFLGGALTSVVLNLVDPQLQQRGLPTVLNPQYAALTYFTRGAWSNYHGLFTSVRMSAFHGLTGAANYTWSRCLDTAGTLEDTGGSTPTTPFNLDFDYGDCLTDRRHVAQLYGTYELPWWRARRAGGWYLAFVQTYASGAPLTVDAIPVGLEAEQRKASPHFGVTGAGGVAVAGDPARGGTGVNMFRDPAKVFAALRPLLLSRDGRSMRGAFRTMGQWNLDLSVGKQTAVRESLRAIVALDLFNVFNHTIFAPGTVSINNPAAFGVVSAQANAPRSLQLSLRVEF